MVGITTPLTSVAIRGNPNAATVTRLDMPRTTAGKRMATQPNNLRLDRLILPLDQTPTKFSGLTRG